MRPGKNLRRTADHHAAATVSHEGHGFGLRGDQIGHEARPAFQRDFRGIGSVSTGGRKVGGAHAMPLRFEQRD